MRQRLLIIITLIVVVVILVLQNAATYVKVEPQADSEAAPDRSTFNAGATGTRALFDFLHESGQWAIITRVTNIPWYDLDPTNFEQMTHEVKTIAPSQPTLLARDVESVLPSRFAGAITIVPRVAPEKKNTKSSDIGSAAPGDEEDEEEFEPSPEPTQSAVDG